MGSASLLNISTRNLYSNKKLYFYFTWNSFPTSFTLSLQMLKYWQQDALHNRKDKCGFKDKSASEDYQQLFFPGLSQYRRNTKLSTLLNSVMKNCNRRKTLKLRNLTNN